MAAPKPVLDQAGSAAMQGEAALRNRLVTEAYGTKAPQRGRVPQDYQK